MRSVCNLFLAVSLLAVSGCTMYDTYSEVDALNDAQPVGSPFTQSLAEEYKALANKQLSKMLDYPDALHFARKGLAAADGEAVMPEPVTDWNLSESHIKELSAARGRLMITFDLGGREIAPSTAALAQAKYDCWIESQEEHWVVEDAVECKDDFMNAVSELEGLVQQAPPPPEPTKETVEVKPLAPEEAMYLVFFNWDSTDLSSGAKSVLDAIAQEVSENPPEQIIIDGHADTSGTKEYNKRLALKRAEAVQKALSQRGVGESLMVVESSGEEELLVETSDNVREPANRRVNISFR